MPIVGVMGSGTDSHSARAARLGIWLAERGFHLLTGGGGGVMGSVSRAFHGVRDRRGLVIGILPSVDSEPARAPEGYPNPWVELPIFTHLPLSGERGAEPLSRNHINVLSSDVVVALPGGPGTRSELLLALAYGRPVIAWAFKGDGVPARVPLAGEFDEVAAFVLEHADRGRRQS